MGRHPGWLFRDTVEDSKRLRIDSIKSLLRGEVSGITSTWTNNRTGESFKVDIGWDSGDQLEITYTTKDGWPIQYSIRRLMTPSNLGNGFRYWFQCPGLRDGNQCYKRVGILYLPPGAIYFACRHCYRLPYQDQLLRMKQFDGLPKPQASP